MEADAFLSTLSTGTDNKEEVREVTDQLFSNGKGDDLLPPQSKSLDEYYKNFTDSQKRAFEWVKHNIEASDSQILAALIGAAGCCNGCNSSLLDLVVNKVAPSGVAASLRKGYNHSQLL